MGLWPQQCLKPLGRHQLRRGRRLAERLANEIGELEERVTAGPALDPLGNSLAHLIGDVWMRLEQRIQRNLRAYRGKRGTRLGVRR